MAWWWSKKKPVAETAISLHEKIQQRYSSFRELLALNNECLEVLASIQEDLQFVPPTRDLLSERVSTVFEKTGAVVRSLEHLSGLSYKSLEDAVEAQRNEVERHLAEAAELKHPRMAVALSNVDSSSGPEVGAKASTLGEVKNILKMPVPDGFVITSEAYKQFCGIPLWRNVRDTVRGIDLDDLHQLHEASEYLINLVQQAPLPHTIEVALTQRAEMLRREGYAVALRSSAVGEGGSRTFAGQFLSILNVPQHRIVEIYKKVVAGRFSERALFYRLSAGLPEVESPMAVLCLGVVRARAAGILYTRDPKDPKSDTMWITATHGLGLDIASGRAPADLFIVERKSPHRLIEQNILSKKEEIVLPDTEGIYRRPVPPERWDQPSLNPEELKQLAEYALRIEKYYATPQDIEFAIDEQGRPWIVQTRSLALIESADLKGKAKPKGEPVLTGGRTIFPGRVSGAAFLVSDASQLDQTPDGAILFLRRAWPGIVTVFPRVSGIVAEIGNVAGHAAALLRESKIPSIFGMEGAFDQLKNGDPVSLDAVLAKLYPGAFWEPRPRATPLIERYREKSHDPVNERILVLNLTDPSGSNFRPSGCQSAHDVLRFCHEKGIEAMFDVNDDMSEGVGTAKRLITTGLPLNIFVLDLGGGLAKEVEEKSEVTPPQITSRPFQAVWKGISHPGVSWQRNMPASLGDLASVISNSLTSQPAMRALGDRSYLLAAEEYLNWNSRLAYHFTLLDACVSDNPSNNYICFRFAGGGAAAYRRNLRACFVEGCLQHYGFLVDRRNDVVNAWFKKAPAAETEANLDIVGRLMVTTSQLDMYMTHQGIMKWYVQQFLAGNYTFVNPEENKENKEVPLSTR